MSIQKFSQTIQSQIYKNWLAKLDKNIVTASAESLRSREQSASKTSFYITKDTVQDMFKTITGKSLDSVELQLFMQEIAKPIGDKKTGAVSGKKIQVNGKDAIFFESIGFDTISTRLTGLLNSYPEVEDAYIKAERDYETKALAELQSSPKYKSMPLAEKKKAMAEIEKKAKERGTFGYYFNKGHVISIATNLAKQFKDQIAQADKLATEERAVLIDVLDKYILKLEKDDLASANLPTSVDQELYAGYVKNSSKYLVEIQHRVGNIESGSASVEIVKELRKLFSASATDLVNIIKSSPSLGQSLLEGEGSPSLKTLIRDDIVNALLGKSLSKKTYTQAPKLISKKTNKIKKPPSNKSLINKAKSLKAKVKSVKKDPKAVVVQQGLADLTNLVSLQSLLDAQLVQRVKDNMGSGSSRDVLNLRSGRLAESAKVERLSESRAGMITAFYSYMKNPYATFSQGGRQQSPRSRDPKALISKSIREIAATQVGNRLRAVLV
jgi:hypothetical protein